MTDLIEASARSSPQTRRYRPFQIFRVPMLLGLITAAGLLSALLGDGLWDMGSWLALGLPVAVGIWCALRRRRSGPVGVD